MSAFQGHQNLQNLSRIDAVGNNLLIFVDSTAIATLIEHEGREWCHNDGAFEPDL